MKRFLSRLLPTHWALMGLAVGYLLTRNPYASFGDSLGMLYHASLGFDWATNATSHFLYVNLCALSLKLLPFLNQVLVLSLISWGFALLCLHRFAQLLKLAGTSDARRALILVIMGLSFSWWRQTVMIEVYTFSCWVGLGVILAMVRDELATEKSLPAAWRIGLWWGLSLLAHIQFLLLLPVLAWHFWRRKRVPMSQLLQSLGLAILVSSPLWLLPLLLETHSLKAVLFDQGYQEQVLQFDLLSLLQGSLRSLGYLLYNFHLWVLLLAIGLWRSWQQHRYWFWLAVLGGGPLWLFAMRYNVTDTYVFFLFPYFLLWTAVGAASSQRLSPSEGSLGGGNRPNSEALIPFPPHKQPEQALIPGIRFLSPSLTVFLAFLLPPLVYGLSWKIAEQVPQVRAFAEPKAYKGGVRYYVWPGQAYSPDPLSLAKAIHLKQRAPIPDFDRYPIAIRYLQSRGELPGENESPPSD